MKRTMLVTLLAASVLFGCGSSDPLSLYESNGRDGGPAVGGSGGSKDFSAGGIGSTGGSSATGGSAPTGGNPGGGGAPSNPPAPACTEDDNCAAPLVCDQEKGVCVPPSPKGSGKCKNHPC